MGRYSRVAVLLAVSLMGCGDAGDTFRDALAQGSRRTEDTPDRVQQQLGGARASLDTTAAARLSAAFRGASAQALPAVVQIATIAVGETSSAPFLPGLQHPEMEPQPMQGSGSGFIFDPRGLILTNAHVVRDALSLNVVLLDGREFAAQVIGTDASTDVAVIRIDPGTGSLPVIEMGDSDQLKVGDWVIALGNPMGLTFTATAGIVSATNRSIGVLRQSSDTPLEAFIQTDAVINPGNSGGPLVDLNGRVVGINTAISSSTGYFTGAGFAIPIALARKIADDIVQFGVAHRPRLGVQIDDVNAADAELYQLPSVTGVEVTAVTTGTPAHRAGMQLGDVITSLNGQPVGTVAELQARVARFAPGDRLEVGYIRYGQRRRATVQLGEFEAVRAEAPPARVERDANPLGFRINPLPAAIAQRIGMRGDNIPVVTTIDPLGPAASSQLRRGHVVQKFNGRDIRTVRDLERAAGGIRAGQIVSLIVVNVNDPELTPMIVNYRAQ